MIFIDISAVMPQEWREWRRQSLYDLETAHILQEAGRCAYAVFLAHLTVEKALKGLYVITCDDSPPKTHNLNYLADRCELVVPDDVRLFMRTLSETPILAFYPDHLEILREAYDADSTRKLLAKTRELLDWIDDHFPQAEARA